MEDRDNTVTVEFDRDEYERLRDVADSPAELIHEATIDRIDDDLPTWSLGSLFGNVHDSPAGVREPHYSGVTAGAAKT